MVDDSQRIGARVYTALAMVVAFWASSQLAHAQNQMLTSDQLSVQIGEHGHIASLTLANDAFPTNYVMSASNARACPMASVPAATSARTSSGSFSSRR